MSIFKNNKEEEEKATAAEPHVEQESEVLSAEDVKALAPLYDNVVLALKQVYDPEIPVTSTTSASSTSLSSTRTTRLSSR